VETLAERITREGPVNELDAVGWIVRLAKKLEAMHGRGLAHGAVCPEAMKTASASRLSLGMLIPTGAIRNRLEFRSPERLDSEASSPTDDTWSTAATLYALITGQSPFAAGDEDSIRRKIRAGAFASLSTFDVGDDDLQHIIEAALNPTMAQRTSSLAAFRTALEGWHPDSKVRELPPMVDDQPDDDDEDARTVMRPVSAADAVRALIQQREQASASRAPEAPAKAVTSTSNEPAPQGKPGVPVANHGLLEDDDENAKTAMISVSPLAYLNKGPATVPAPPPTDMKSAPPPASGPSTGFGVMRAPGGQAARAPAARGGMAKSTVVGGFNAQELMAQAKAAVPPPVAAAPTPGISREAVLDDVDNEATVMREAPLDVLRQATASIAPPAAGDRKTPVDPTSAAVAAMTATASVPPEAKPPETSMSFGAISLIEDISEGGAAVEPRETPVSPSRGLNVKEVLGGAPRASTPSSSGQAPAAATSGLATSSLTAPSTPGMAAPAMPAAAPAPAIRAPSTPAMPAAAPAPARAPVAQPPAAPLAAPEPQQPSALKGLFIGIGLAILILAAAAGAYFALIKR